jgi:hypothetical protein
MAVAEQGAREIPAEALKRYERILDDINITDQISFRLLEFVPLVSGSGILGSAIAAILIDNKGALPAVVFLSLFGALVTFGFYRWERRNIQTCSWLKRRAEEMERDVFGLERGHFFGRADAPRFLGLEFGKTEAERVIYTTTIAAWLLLPLVVVLARFLA